MPLSDEQIKELLRWYATSSETRKRDAQKRKDAYEENRKWIDFDVIQNMSEDELASKFKEYF